MIKEILKLVISEGMLDKNQIAREVGIQAETLDDIIRLLVERGYLRMEQNGCDIEASCAGCHSAGGCSMITKTGQVFYVTEKGRAYANTIGGGNK
ncbi:MAG: FeoC-like transcriptional regulator [Candidatus Thorarchaeota archaeon]